MATASKMETIFFIVVFPPLILGSILPDVHWTGILDPSEYIDSHRQWGSWAPNKNSPSGPDNLYQKSWD